MIQLPSWLMPVLTPIGIIVVIGLLTVAIRKGGSFRAKIAGQELESTNTAYRQKILQEDFMNSFVRFIRDKAPILCGVNPALGKTAEIVYLHERENGGFEREKFSSTRERAYALLPYAPKDQDGYERCADIIELAFQRHYEKFHPEFYDAHRREELEELEGGYLDQMIKEDTLAGVSSWWST